MTPPHIEPALAHLAQFMELGIPYNREMGLRVERLVVGECVIRLPWRDVFIGDPGRPAVHGGVTSMVLDTAGGLACFSRLTDPSHRLSTVDLRVDYLQPGPAADLVCVARCLRMGNRVAVAAMRVYAERVPDDGTTGGFDASDAAFAIGQAVYNVHRR